MLIDPTWRDHRQARFLPELWETLLHQRAEWWGDLVAGFVASLGKENLPVIAIIVMGNRCGVFGWRWVTSRKLHNTWAGTLPMSCFRITLGGLMLAVVLIAFHLAVVCLYPPPFGLDNLEVGLLPSVTVLAFMLRSTRGRHGEGGRLFVRGFMISLAVAICVYLVACVATPDLVRRPVVYYINRIEPSLYDADLSVVYRLSLEIQGLILGLPQLLFALVGGAMTKAIGTASRCSAAGG